MDVVFTILTVIGWILLGVLGFIVFLLNMPYLLKAEVEGDENHAFAGGCVGWPLRLLGVAFHVSIEAQRYTFFLFRFALKSGPIKRGEKKEKKKKEKKEKKKKTLAQIMHGLNTPGTVHLAKAIARWLFLRGTVKGRVGFSDPANTGQLAVGIAMLRSVFPGLFKDVVLDYTGARLEGRANLLMCVWLPRIVLGALVFLVSVRGREMIRHYIARPKPAKVTT